MKIFLFLTIMGAVEYTIGFFMGRRYTQHEIQEMRSELGLDTETGEKKE